MDLFSPRCPPQSVNVTQRCKRTNKTWNKWHIHSTWWISIHTQNCHGYTTK